MKTGQNRQGTQNKPTLYGFHAVREAWLNPERTVINLYVTDQSRKGFEATLQEAKNKGLRRPAPTIIDKNQIDRMLPRDAVHQGLALAANPLPETGVDDFVISAGNRARTVLIMLDQVTDPHNVGAILRSACAFGASGMVLQRMHAPALEGVLAKTACGAVEHVPVAYETNLSRAIETLKDGGFFVIGLDEHDKNSIGKINFPEKTLLVLGSEGEGIRRLVKENCDVVACLPTHGPIHSLNVSNAAAVALFAATK
ncbi:MAG TPA: 23S rRNA (guanosine(2251)-2'-O)-methyltransferase RlmB [Rhodospirillaceae bacterium]|nr:23S rRNA (guanosine(2251)-2'-O)-methyltransferase RlmB [Rhodospirillaceae bacterium]